MSIRLVEHPDHWVVSTEVAPGKRRKLPRGHVRVGKGDPAALRTEIIKQTEASYLAAGVDIPPEEPVV